MSDRDPFGDGVQRFKPEWMDAPPPPREWLLTCEERDGSRVGVLEAGRVAFLASTARIGKSHAIYQLVAAVAGGAERTTKWLGIFDIEKGGRVLLITSERDDEIRRGLYDAAETMGLDEKQRALAAKHIVPLGLAGRDDVALTSTRAPGRDESEFSIRLRTKLEDHSWTAIIIDPLSRFAGGDVEKSDTAANRMVVVLERYAQLPGSPTVIVTHDTDRGRWTRTAAGLMGALRRA